MRAGQRRHRVAAAFGAAVLAVVALAGCSAPEGEVDLPPQIENELPAETQEQLSGAVQHAMGTIGASGAIVGVWAPWSGSWVEGLGTQTPDGPAVTADLQFRIAQVTRPMTCDVLYAVAGEGTVSIDDPVSQYVSGVADLQDVTLEQLCDGTSGIGSYSPQLSPLWTANPARVWNPREIASYGLGQPRTTEPGVAYRDSDAGYVLLGLALERATGKSAATLIDEYIAEPLGLTATLLPSGTPAAPAGGAGALTGQISLPGEDGALDCAAPADVSTISASIGYTDSGVVSNVEDLRTYAQALATGALIPEAAAETRFSDPRPLYDGAPSWLNVAGGAVIAGSLVGHYGSMPGYATAAFSDPDSGLTVVVVLNNSVRGADPAVNLAWELAAIASKAPAASGQTAPEAGLPWTPETYHEAIAAAAVCTPDAAP
jgi:Beta-lactamase class C and other penicillin binding proteins